MLDAAGFCRTSQLTTVATEVTVMEGKVNVSFFNLKSLECTPEQLQLTGMGNCVCVTLSEIVRLHVQAQMHVLLRLQLLDHQILSTLEMVSTAA